MNLDFLWVAAGGAIGSVWRYWLSGAVARHFGETFPWGTILVNVTGCLAIGFFATLTGPDGRWMLSQGIRQQFVMLGICGGYTTFSSFSLQNLTLLQAGQCWQAGANIVLSVVGCLVAVWIGHVLATAINTHQA